MAPAYFFQTAIRVAIGMVPAATDSVVAALRQWPQQAALIAVTAVWQGAFIAVGLAILLRLAPCTSAEHRFSIWAAAFVSLVGLPLLTLYSMFPHSVISIVSSTTAESSPKPLFNRPWLSIDARWSLLIAVIWIAATIYRAASLVLHSFRLRKVWQEAIQMEPSRQLSLIMAATAITWKRKPVEVCATMTLRCPSVIGFFKPRILIPNWLFARLTPGEFEQIVLHEMEHLRRLDDWTNLLQKLCLVLFPLNPALFWIEHRLCREREMACDEAVVRTTRAPRAYAACLANLAERGLKRGAEALSLGAWQLRPELVYRVHSILQRKSTLGPLGNGALLGALGCSLLFCAIELAQCPLLIAFVPPCNQEGRALVANQMAPQLERAAGTRRGNTGDVGAFDTSYVQTPNPGVGSASSAERANEVKTILPENGYPRTDDVRVSMQQNAVKQAAILIFMKPSYKADFQLPYAVSLNAGMPSAQSGPAEGQWIVVAVWEQVQSPNRSVWLVTDYETDAIADSTGDGQNKIARNNNASSLPTGQFSVARLIFRLSPARSAADSESTQPAIVPPRNGWLVLQL